MFMFHPQLCSRISGVPELYTACSHLLPSCIRNVKHKGKNMQPIHSWDLGPLRTVFLAVKVFFRVHSKKKSQSKSPHLCFCANVCYPLEYGLPVQAPLLNSSWLLT